VRAQLEREAADQSRRSAAELAKPDGVRIQGLHTICDVAPNFAYGIQAGSWPTPVALVCASPASPAPVADRGATVELLEAGSITLTENIYAVFLIAQ
jgi:hypothetical protein